MASQKEDDLLYYLLEEPMTTLLGRYKTFVSCQEMEMNLSSYFLSKLVECLLVLNKDKKCKKSLMKPGLEISLQTPRHAAYRCSTGPVVCLIEDGQYLSFSIYGC